MELFRIYTLTDPITDEIRYVGQTIRTLNHRLRGHLTETYVCKKRNWIRSLKPLIPKIELLEDCSTLTECNDLEKFWIAYLKFVGCNLTNMSPGGIGSNGFKQSAETIQKRVQKTRGMTRSTESKKNYSEGRKIFLKQNPDFIIGISEKLRAGQTPKTFKKISDFHKGIPKTRQHAMNISKALQGKKHSPERIQNMRNGKKKGGPS